MSASEGAQLIYLASAILFVVGLKRLTKVRTAQSGNIVAGVAMLLAVLGALVEYEIFSYQWILIGVAAGAAVGAFAAQRVPMTEMPEMVAIFNGVGGAASGFVALSVLWG
ncbi:MAG: NAD(P)(+) transhydrogenase (Re/Si-specific) subunit beta, partial [Myxococcota bacterium]